jgi:hypothetical protein
MYLCEGLGRSAMTRHSQSQSQSCRTLALLCRGLSYTHPSSTLTSLLLLDGFLVDLSGVLISSALGFMLC